MILTENCQILCRKKGINPDFLGIGGTMCPCFYLNNFDSDTSNLWGLGGLHAAQRGEAGKTGDPLLGEWLLRLCIVITLYHCFSSLPIYLIPLSWQALQKIGPQCLVVKQYLLCRGCFKRFGFIIRGESVFACWEGEMPSGKSVRETVCQ